MVIVDLHHIVPTGNSQRVRFSLLTNFWERRALKRYSILSHCDTWRARTTCVFADKVIDWETVDLKKLRVKELKKVLENWGEVILFIVFLANVILFCFTNGNSEVGLRLKVFRHLHSQHCETNYKTFELYERQLFFFFLCIQLPEKIWFILKKAGIFF